MSKRHVQTTAEADNDASAVEAPPEAPRASNGQFQPRGGNRALKTMPEPTERAWENDTSAYANPRASIEDILAASAEADPDAAGPPADVEPSEDPDQAPPAEAAAPAAAAPPPETREVQPTYLNAEQRAALARRLDESKAQRAKDVAFQKLETDHKALLAKLNSPRLADRIEAAGKTPEEMLEDLLMGRGDAADTAVASAAGVSPEVAELRAQVEALRKERADEKAAAVQQATQQQKQQAVTRLGAIVTREQGFHMIASLRQHQRLLDEIEAVYDGSSDIAQVTQVVADRIEAELRTSFPEVAAVLAAGGSGAAVAAAAKADGAPVQGKAKASLGARGRVPANDEPVNDLPMDPGERHQGTKDRYFPNWRR